MHMGMQMYWKCIAKVLDSFAVALVEHPRRSASSGSFVPALQEHAVINNEQWLDSSRRATSDHPRWAFLP